MGKNKHIIIKHTKGNKKLMNPMIKKVTNKL